MKKWKQKAIVQKTISFLPFGNKINYLFQKYVTKGVYLNDEYFYDRLSHATSHLSAFSKYWEKAAPASSLEIGTGWYPIVPLAFFLSGTDKIYSVDISMLTNKERLKTTFDRFMDCQKAAKLKDYIKVLPDRWAIFTEIYDQYDKLNFEEILKKINLIYLIEDARKLSLPDNSVELINSNNTFEHIYPNILKPIIKDFIRVLDKENGIMSHFIDMSDHFAHFDKTINIYNFLQFSDSKWSWIDNSIQPQNRLRYQDYLNMYQELALPVTEFSIRAGNLQELSTIKLDKKYSILKAEELAISHCHLISKF
jgi:hypothetical protein